MKNFSKLSVFVITLLFLFSVGGQIFVMASQQETDILTSDYWIPDISKTDIYEHSNGGSHEGGNYAYSGEMTVVWSMDTDGKYKRHYDFYGREDDGSLCDYGSHVDDIYSLKGDSLYWELNSGSQEQAGSWDESVISGARIVLKQIQPGQTWNNVYTTSLGFTNDSGDHYTEDVTFVGFEDIVCLNTNQKAAHIKVKGSFVSGKGSKYENTHDFSKDYWLVKGVGIVKAEEIEVAHYSNNKTSTFYIKDELKAIKQGSAYVSLTSPDSDNDGFHDDIDRFPNDPYVTPVILIHGRNDDTERCFGAYNEASLMNDQNNGEVAENYITPTYQEIREIIKADPNNISVPYNVADVLEEKGYTKNTTLFAFSYPNWNIVGSNAGLLNRYIDNLIAERKSKIEQFEKEYINIDPSYYSLFPTKDLNYCKFDIVAHSMGGLVSRYYIENIEAEKLKNGEPERIRKLITIDTPHWGSGEAWWAWITDSVLKQFLPCDSDLRQDAPLFGKKYVGYQAAKYTATALANDHREVKYYAIAGFDVMDPSFGTWTSIPNCIVTIDPDSDSILITEEIFKQLPFQKSISNMVAFSSIGNWEENGEGDVVVNTRSQIGWGNTNLRTYPNEKIKMEKVSINIDFIRGHTLSNLKGQSVLLHTENQHRMPVINRAYEYLKE